MASGDAEQVKERTDIAQLVGETIVLKRAGQNFKALCPFHQEKTPSFVVSPSRQSFHCFGCGKGGDCFTWLMEREGMTFPEALRVLASRAGITLSFERPERREVRDRLRATLDAAADFYHAILLKAAESKEARGYLASRGIHDESVRKWRLGFVPSGGSPLARRAADRGITEKDLLDAGILGQGRSGVYERFFGRLLFPLSDGHGSVVGFAGRILKEDPNRPSAKYINSPETVLYRKSSILYGLAAARDAIRQKREVIVVEGYTDVICSHQAGVQHVVATSGTALTGEHVAILKRYADRVVFAFDADAAGGEATRRAIDSAFMVGMEVSVLVLPEGKDPADLAVSNPAVWVENTQRHTDMFSFLLNRAVSQWGTDTTAGKKAIVADLLPVVARIPDAVARGTLIQEIAERIKVDAKYVQEDLDRVSHTNDRVASRHDSLPESGRDSSESDASPTDPLARKEDRLIALLLTVPHLAPIVKISIQPKHLRNEQNRRLYEMIMEGKTESLPEDLWRRADAIRLAWEVEEAEDSLKRPEADAAALVRELLSAHLRNELRDATDQLRNVSGKDRETLLSRIRQIHHDLAQAGQITLS